MSRRAVLRTRRGESQTDSVSSLSAPIQHLHARRPDVRFGGKAAEIAENYGGAPRISATDYSEDLPLCEAVADLSRFGTEFKGPNNASGLVTA
jgi:hypothetical protein